MNAIKPIQTEYKGYLFRSRLEARWAVFFDACHLKWEYEPEGFVLRNGQHYLPDFLIHGVAGRAPSDLYVEVKGKMSPDDADKIYLFSDVTCTDTIEVANPILVVAGIPDGESMKDIDSYCSEMGSSGFPGFESGPYPFNFETIDGDNFVAHPGVNKNGQFQLFGDDSSHLCERDDFATLKAFKLARQARFEHGEKPGLRR